jgi:hypothetical protein
MRSRHAPAAWAARQSIDLGAAHSGCLAVGAPVERGVRTQAVDCESAVQQCHSSDQLSTERHAGSCLRNGVNSQSRQGHERARRAASLDVCGQPEVPSRLICSGVYRRTDKRGVHRQLPGLDNRQLAVAVDDRCVDQAHAGELERSCRAGSAGCDRDGVVFKLDLSASWNFKVEFDVGTSGMVRHRDDCRSAPELQCRADRNVRIECAS